MRKKMTLVDLQKFYIEDNIRLRKRIKELEAEAEDWKHRKECADEFIEDIKHTIIDPNYKPFKEYGNLRGLAIFSGIRRLHELVGINCRRGRKRNS